jgi:hypothetical protein
LKKTLAGGDDVSLLYDLVTKTPAGTQSIAEPYRASGDRIGAIHFPFDERPFAVLCQGQ